MVQCRCTQAFVVISRYDGGLALQRRRNKAPLVTDSRCTGKWRKQNTVYLFLSNDINNLLCNRLLQSMTFEEKFDLRLLEAVQRYRARFNATNGDADPG